MARGAVLQRIKPLHPEMIPPPGSVPAGVTEEKKQLFRLITKRSRAVPRYVDTPEARAREKELKAEGKTTKEVCEIMTAEGLRLYMKNQTTGQNAYPMNRSELYDLDELFFLVSEGNGNIRKQSYYPPTAEELAETRRTEKIKEWADKLAARMVDADVSPDQLVQALFERDRDVPGESGPESTTPAPPTSESAAPSTAESVAPKVTYPLHLGFGKWALSNGEEFQGKKAEAEKAEAALPQEVHLAAQEARATADATPDY